VGGGEDRGYDRTLTGEGRALWGLDTESLEKIYMALFGQSPRRDYSREKKEGVV